MLSLISGFNEAYIPASGMPKPLTDLYNPNGMKLSYPELLQSCEQIYDSISFTFDQAVTVEKETRTQAKSRTWFEQRSGRITASKLREVLHTDPLQPSISLIKSICYPEMRLFTSAACKYGCDHEDTARLKYFELMGKVHKKLIVIQSGLILDPMYPFLGATPDGLVHCECCQSGVLEIKCPYSCKDKTFTDAAQQKSFCLQENEDGSLKLKQDHSYYYQIQMQMMLCHVEYGEFVVWREGGSIHHERILFNSDFMDDASENIEMFIKFAILPELVGKWFTKQPVLPLKPNSNEDTSSNLTPVWCYCRRDEEFDTMIGCDNEQCTIQWYHLSCLQIPQSHVPKGKWYCPDCHKERSKVKKKQVDVLPSKNQALCVS